MKSALNIFCLLLCSVAFNSQANTSQSKECKLDAIELAARVITNINAGKSDFFWHIDLTDYKRKGCDKQLIMKAVKAML
jgi:hypothetical protein